MRLSILLYFMFNNRGFEKKTKIWFDNYFTPMFNPSDQLHQGDII